jgi:4-amino-4-deoxy-L-arabinose transferase-like glycosyltransferase
LALLWVTLALLWFAPLNRPHVFDPDEGRYGEIPREMVASGDWVTPRLDGIKYFEKPALGYWATALAFELFGQHAWTVRLWPALAGFLGLLLTGALARRLYGARAALLALLVQTGAMLYIGSSRIATLDMGLSFALQLAMTALALLAPPAQMPARAAWRAPLLLGVGVALAVLIKGLVGIVIPGAVAVIYLLIYRDWRLLLRAQPWWTLIALLLIAAPWFVLVSVRNPEFAHFFFIFEHFERYLNSARFDRYQPVWFFLPILALGFMPWTTLLPGALRRGWQAARHGERATAMLIIWAAFILVFFSLSQSKLTPYIVPMLPALCLLTGRAVADMDARRFAAHLAAVAIIGALIALTILLLWSLPAMAALLARASTSAIVGLICAWLLLGLGGAIGWLLARRGMVLGATAAAALGGLLLAQSALLAAEQLPRMRALVTLERVLQRQAQPATRLFCVGNFLQPIPFYLQRPCTLVGYRGELDFGLRLEPWLGIADVAALVPIWQQQSDALAIVRPEDYRQMQALGAPMRVIYTGESLVVVSRQ